MLVPGFRFVQAAGDYADRDGMHYGIAIHATSNTASDESEASYASHREDGTSAHSYVDWDSLIQALDTDRKAGHAGSAYGNENAIAIEFTGLESWTRERWLSSIAWDQVGTWIAYILTHDPDYRGFQVRRASVAEMKANPKVQAFYGHNDMRLAWGGTDHTDPGDGFPWDRLFSAVNAALNTIASQSAAPTGDDEMKTLARFDGDPTGAVFLTDFVTAKWVKSEGELNDYKTLAAEGALTLAYNGAVRVVGRRELVGEIVGDVPDWWQLVHPAPTTSS